MRDEIFLSHYIMVKQGHVSHPAMTDWDAHGKVRYQD